MKEKKKRKKTKDSNQLWRWICLNCWELFWLLCLIENKIQVYGLWVWEWSLLMCYIWDVTSFTNEGVCCMLVNFPLKPLLAIINNKQVEYISSAGSSSRLQSDWLAWPWGTALQYLERGVAEMEMGVHWWHPLSGNPITSGNSSCHKQLPLIIL